MYGTQLSSQSSPYILETIDRLRFKREGFRSLACKSAKKLCNESTKLFHVLIENACDNNDSEDESERFAANIDTETTRHLRNICAITERLIILMRDEAFYGKSEELLAWVSERYGANTTPISLQSILADTATNGGMRASQEELMSVQIISIHKAICQLPEIRHCIEIERNNRKQQFYRNKPERQAIRGERSAVSDAIWNKMQKMLPVERAFGKSSEWIIRLIWDLQQVHDQSAIFARHGNLICWLEMDDRETRLCAIPKSLDKRLFSDQWKNCVPTVLTSGTLSAGGDFTHTKRTLGLDLLGGKLAETSKQSPFNYKENVLLYISENVPFPNQRDMQYIDAVADETERLINAAHGHTAVLFTSYRVMDMVWERLTNRGMDFPMFRLNKGGAGAIEQFKQSGNGVLFASGALWEGIDIPGDTLSMLIIVKLPFSVPDPISEYEQTLYKDMDEYKRFVIVPEMLIKLMQGFGRLIRTETDTGVVAILDCRVGLYGAYRIESLSALPGCNVTAQIRDVERFIKAKKPQDYFKYSAFLKCFGI
jgi:Rad3-related DNA helicase